MKKNILIFALLLSEGITLLALPRLAFAEEQRTPFQPGATTGTPVGALPPPGIYLNTDVYINSGDVVNGNGSSIGVKIQTTQIAPMILWVPNIKIFGAQYAASIIQPYAYVNTDGADAGGATEISSGLFNTIISPEQLSWKLGDGLFFSQGLTVYLKDGDYRHTGTRTDATAFANNFWTFEPNVAISYLKNGWDLTGNTVFDFSTKNNTTDYQSGDVFYLDWTVAHQFDQWTIGAIGNYTQQFSDDTQFGKVVQNTGGDGFGNRYMLVSAGPMVAYNFGKVTLSLRYLKAIKAANGGKPSFLHIGISFSFI